MLLASPSCASSARRHCPMQGPQALASTVAPTERRAFSCPSRSTVARVRSEPGVTQKGTAARRPRARACSATSAARVMS